MKRNHSLVVIIGLVAATQVVSAANIVGTVTLKGAPPAEVQNAQLKADATCGPMHPDMPTTHHYVVGPKGELANVVVMLKGITGKSTGATAAPAVIDQKGCEYVPTILAVQTGQKIVVKNSDPVLHNVHTDPQVAGNKEENLPQMPAGPDLTFSIPKAENFLKFKCDVHPWMFAWVTVVDSPYFALTGKDGKFTIKDVPPGKYTVVAMHRKAAPAGVEKEVEVKDGDVTADFTIELK
jgi:plastocyanin